MDLDITESTKEGEITQFLCDVRDYFKATLATSEYENTSNMFYLTASETSEKLLNRCECLLNRLNNKNQTLFSAPLATNSLENCQWQQIKGKRDPVINGSISLQQDEQQVQQEDVSYLDMSAAIQYNNVNKRKSPTRKIVDFNSSGESDKTFRCSTLVAKQNKSFLHRTHDTMTTTTDDESEEEEIEGHNDKIDKYEDNPQIYDICQVTTQGSDGEEDEVGHNEIQKSITADSKFSLPYIDCPYMDLPAGHLSIQKSTKYGQLQRIEKRLFFDQSKKCYCGILNDWLLCYAEGPTSNKPTVILYLKMHGIDIEHFGEGKRRDVCFQITTRDPHKRFVFQAVNDIDAKEWIHAIETAIRSDNTAMEMRNSSIRKLPTPPVMKKTTFLSSFQMSTSTTLSDCIYEEPSPIHHVQNVMKSCLEKPPELPNKQSSSSSLPQQFEYDVPKCPPQPFKCYSGPGASFINPNGSNKTDSEEKNYSNTLSATYSLSSSPPSAPKSNLKIEENLDFQAKIKDVHSKLTSQLLCGPNIKKSLKKSLSSISQNDAEPSIFNAAFQTYTPPTSAELKKQKKSITPQNSPQKSSTEKASFTKNWFLNRLNKTTSSTRSNTSSPSNSPSKYKQSEKENLLNSFDVCDSCDIYDSQLTTTSESPILKTSSPTSGGTSKVNMIINQLEASGHLTSMFSVDTMTSLSSFCDNDGNNYEPIMNISTLSSSFMKKV